LGNSKNNSTLLPEKSMASLSDVLVRQLLQGRYIASLATHNSDDTIHVVAVWYWFDGSNIYIATDSKSRKARNLKANPKASIMIDSRAAEASFGINVTGTVKVLSGEISRSFNENIHRKYLSEAALKDPKVGPVFAAWDDVTLQIAPTSVIAWDMREADHQVFGDSFKNNPGYLLPLEK